MNRNDEIRTTLNEVRDYWLEHPELRLGQLLVNCASLTGIDLYAVEDCALPSRLDRLRTLESTVKRTTSVARA